ncbi:MAG: ABC-type transport auxiliary lipoprotein family protein [Rhodanobacter sp.]
MSLRPRHALAAVALVLSACSVLPKAVSPDIYLLPAAPVAASPTTTARLDWSLRVDTPQAGRAIDSTRIAVVPSGDVITVYEGARWSDRAPVLLRNRLLDAFRADGRFTAVSSDDANLFADVELTGDLLAFQTNYENGSPVVVIRYDAQLVQVRTQKILATHRFDIRQPVVGKEVPQVVAAFGQASDQLAAQTIGWISTLHPGG